MLRDIRINGVVESFNVGPPDEIPDGASTYNRILRSSVVVRIECRYHRSTTPLALFSKQSEWVGTSHPGSMRRTGRPP